MTITLTRLPNSARMVRKNYVPGPEYGTAEDEKRLLKIATKGVVHLFNSVRQHQKEQPAIEEVKKSDKTLRKKGDGMLSTAHHLSLLPVLISYLVLSSLASRLILSASPVSSINARHPLVALLGNTAPQRSTSPALWIFWEGRCYRRAR